MAWFILIYGVLASGSALLLATRLARVWTWTGAPVGGPRPAGSVSILVPIKGADRRTPDVLQSLVSSVIPGEVEFIFGIESEDDPAFPICRRLESRNPDRNIRIVLSGEPRGLIGKQHNLRHAYAESHGETIVCMDADIEVEPHTIQRGLSHLEGEGVGSAFFLPVYHGDAPLGGRLVEAYLNYHYNLYMGALATVTEPPYIFGGLWMTRRSSLERTGGFEAFGRTVSDDAAIGRAFLEVGLENRLVPENVYMRPEDLGLLAGAKHLGKWLGMLRAEGLGPYLAVWLWWHPAFWSAALLVLGLLTGWLDAATWVYGAIAVGFCLAVKAVTGLILNLGVFRTGALHSVFFLLIYELLAGPVLFGIGLFRRSVTWKGRSYRLGAGGMIMGLEDPD